MKCNLAPKGSREASHKGPCAAWPSSLWMRILKHLETAGVQPVYAVRGSGNIDANGVVSNFQLNSIDVVGYTS